MNLPNKITTSRFFITGAFVVVLLVEWQWATTVACLLTGCLLDRGSTPQCQLALGNVAAALRDNDISMGSMIQRGRDPGEPVPVVITTHVTEEAAMMRALLRIAGFEAIVEAPRMIRIESL